MSIFSFLFGKKIKIKPLELFPEAVIVFSPDSEILKINTYAERLLGIDASKIDDIKIDDVFDCDFEILLKELLQENNICTLKLRDKDVFVEVKASQRTPEEIYFSLRDVTQKHKTVTSFMLEYETSKKINRTKNNLLIKISSELMSPLHSITGFSQAMLEGLSGKIDDKQKRYLNIINKNAYELLALIEQLVESSKLESSNYEFEPKIFDIVDMSNAVLNEIKSQNANIKTYITSSKIEKRMVYTDEAVLKKMVIYLISNLLNSDYGEISVNIEHPDADYAKQSGFEVDENYQQKNYIHMEILSNEDCPSVPNELSVFEIYPQLEKNAKREVLNNLPLYNASLFGKFLKIKLSSKIKGKMGFDIVFNGEKP